MIKASRSGPVLGIASAALACTVVKVKAVPGEQTWVWENRKRFAGPG
ncbi:MAG TPA: hypothetical protein VNZ03_30625 [Terriglobales bacterium]|jgi:hypothetical protein|nr:hypothetical protein [Terriglobales bacterium]